MVAALHRPRQTPTREQVSRLLAQWSGRVDWRSTRLVVWAGSAHWRPWEILRMASPRVQVVCYDPGAPRADVPGVPGVVIAGCETDLIAAVSGLFHSRDRVEICGEPGREVETVRALVDSAVEYAMAMEATIRVQSQAWIDLGLDLLPLCVGRPAVQALTPTWAGRPAIIVGAGPSLEDDLEALGQIRGRAMVIAASSAAGALARGGVVPHAWCCAEQRGEASTELRATYTPGAWLVPGTHCHAAFWELDPARTIPLVMATTGIGSFLSRTYGLPSLSTGGSVTTVCFALARQLGADPIILVGQDCGMVDLERTHAPGRSAAHAAGVAEQLASVRDLGVITKAPAWGGVGTVWTTPALRTFRQWFEQEARTRRVINTSRRGARIVGTHEILLETLRLDEQDLDPGEAIGLAVDGAVRMDRAPMLAALRAERDAAEAYHASALAACASARRCVADTSALLAAGQDHLAASYAVSSLEEVAVVAPRQGIDALAAIAERAADRSPELVRRIDLAIARLEALYD